MSFDNAYPQGFAHAGPTSGMNQAKDVTRKDIDWLCAELHEILQTIMELCSLSGIRADQLFGEEPLGMLVPVNPVQASTNTASCKIREIRENLRILHTNLHRF